LFSKTWLKLLGAIQSNINKTAAHKNNIWSAENYLWEKYSHKCSLNGAKNNVQRLDPKGQYEKTKMKVS